MSCDTKICIYVLKCNGCENIYLGETTNFRLRTNLHKDHASKNIGLNVSRYIYHCTNNLGTSQKFSIMPIFKLKDENTSYRKNMESYLLTNFAPN